MTTFVPPAKVPLGPLFGAKKVTDAWLTGLPLASPTFATKAEANGLLTRALCPLPLIAAIDATPGVIVAVVLAEVKPGADAVIVVKPTLTPVN